MGSMWSCKISQLTHKKEGSFAHIEEEVDQQDSMLFLISLKHLQELLRKQNIEHQYSA